jgi:putative transposase
MPTRKVHAEGTFAHYVTFSCYKRRKYLQPDTCKRIVIGTLGHQLAAQKGICTGFVVMLDHVHALVWFCEEFQISLFMDRWKQLSSEKIAAVYKRDFPKYWSKQNPDDPIWQPRYYGFNIFTERKLREKVNYMHNNPVRAGLVKEMCDWPWSSARFWYFGKSVGLPLSWPP